MSWIWNVVLSFSNDELGEDEDGQTQDTCESLEKINQWIPDGKLVSLVSPTYKKGAGYGMEANLYGGGYKHFDIDGFIKVVEAQKWSNRANVQLWIKGEEDESFIPIPLKWPRAARKKAATRTKGLTKSKSSTRTK
jgi:hypothetical protein